MGIAIPSQQQASPVFNVGPLLQLDQLIAVVAALCPETTPADKVAAAMELCAEVAVQLPNYNAVLRKKQAEHGG